MSEDGTTIRSSEKRDVSIQRFVVPRLPGCDDFSCLEVESPILRRAWPVNRAFIGPDETIIGCELRNPYEARPRAVLAEERILREFVRAGPRERIAFKPEEVTAVIVTCGGLCPGLNTVIRELVMTLHYTYGVAKIWGARMGYRGFGAPLVELTPDSVVDIHLQGGTALGSSRGGFDLDVILRCIEQHRINQVYVIGGDGSHRGAGVVYEGVRKRGLRVAVAAVPKTIDNDIPLVGKSFGFDTAVSEAVKAIISARVEAVSAPGGIGLVRLMGRNSGFIALHATMASHHVAICLIPEMPLSLDHLLEHLHERVSRRKHAVVVVAEGVQFPGMETGETDASGNKKLVDVGLFLKDKIKAHFAAKRTDCNLKYIDPSYMIRSMPANASDSILCSKLARNAVHGAFGGFTGFSVGTFEGRGVLIPIEAVVKLPPVKVSHTGPMFARMVLETGQPSLCDDDGCHD